MKKYVFNNCVINEDNNDYNIIVYDNNEITNLDHKLISDINNNCNVVLYYNAYLYGSIKLINENTYLKFYIKDNILHIINDKEIDIINIFNKSLDKLNINTKNIIILIIILLNNIIDEISKKLIIIENKIYKIENNIILDKKSNEYNLKLVKLRKQCNSFKKDLNSISYFIDELDLYPNIDDKTQQIIHVIENRNNRLINDINAKIEEIIQIKELYQNQLDINLNNSMNLFTIVSTIFLPLTLITSWYGMNFFIPELKFKYGYLIPIVLSVISITITIILIKKFQSKNNN